MPIKPKYLINGNNTASRQFTDRDEFVHAFNRALAREDLGENKVLVYYGVGGIGKTSLIKKICSLVGEDVQYAVLDFKESNCRKVENGIYSLRKSFSNKAQFPLFDLAYTIYWSRVHPNIPINKNSFPFAEESSLVMDIVSTLGEVPVFGLIPKILTLGARSTKSIYNYFLSIKNELHLLDRMEADEIEYKLPFYFAEDFKKYISKTSKRLIIFLDTYENIWSNERNEGSFFEKDEWIRNLASGLPEVLWVICGREKLRWEEKEPEWSPYIEQHLVGELSKIDARKFLDSCEIYDIEIQEAIVQGSMGLPYYLDLAVDTYNHIQDKLQRRVKVEDFAVTPKEVFDRFIRYLDRQEIETLKVLSVPRYFNYEIFDALVKHFGTGYPSTAFYELCRFSFIGRRTSGEDFEMHKLMRESLKTYQTQELLKKVHGFMFRYCGEKIDIAVIDGFSHKANTLLEEYIDTGTTDKLTGETLNYIYSIMGTCRTRLGRYREAEMTYREALNLLRRVGNTKLQEAEYWAALGEIEARLYSHKRAIETYEMSVDLLRKEDSFDACIRSVEILVELGKLQTIEAMYDEAKKTYKGAIKLCIQMIESKEDLGRIYGAMALCEERLGEANCLTGEYEEARNLFISSINNYTRAEELERGMNIRTLMNKGMVFKRLGESQYALGNLKEFIQNINMAIETYDRVLRISYELIEVYEKKGFACTDVMKELVNYPEYTNEARDYFEMGVKAFGEILSRIPNSRIALNGTGSAYRAMGILHKKLGNRLEALEAMREAEKFSTLAIESVPDHPYCYNSRGEALSEVGDLYYEEGNSLMARDFYKRAVWNFEKVLTLTPTAGYAIRNRESVLLKINEVDHNESQVEIEKA